MEWDELESDGMVVIRLRGEVDLQHAPQLREVLQVKVAQRTSVLVLDMTDVRYIDSSGLATLVEYYQQARSYAGQLALAGTTPRVRSVFDLVRLNEVFPFFPTVEDARDQLRSDG